MDALIKKIQNGIESKKFCTVFQRDVEQIVNDRIGIDPKIKKSVEDFAKKHGWKPTITDAGLRVTFRKLP
jgi:hypothetical protein